MALRSSSSGETFPVSRSAWSVGIDMYPSRARVVPSTMVRWVYSRSKAEMRAREMGSEGVRERAAGGSRSSTVACAEAMVSYIAEWRVVLETYSAIS